MELVKCYKCKRVLRLDNHFQTIGKSFVVSQNKKGIIWLCEECDKRRCRRCDILLDNRNRCRCGLKHGAFRKDSKYCLQCEKILKKDKYGKQDILNN